MTEALAARQFGQRGPCVAVIHGWGWDGRLLEPLAQALGERCRVVQPDLPGYGLNLRRSCDGFDDCVSQLARSVPEADVLVGWSLGGLLAMAWAARAPVRKLALIGTSPRFMQASDWPHGMTAERFDAFANAVSEQPLRARTRFAALAALGDDDARGVRAALAARVEQAPLPEPQALAQGLHWLRDIDLRPAMRDLGAQIFSMHGEQDHVINAEASLVTRSDPARRLRIPGAGHLPWLRRADARGDLCNWVCADE